MSAVGAEQSEFPPILMKVIIVFCFSKAVGCVGFEKYKSGRGIYDSQLC